MSEQLKHMKNSLMACAQAQMAHLDTVDAEELGEVIDMIKDIEEAMYYCTITEAMEKKEKEGHNKEMHFYTERIKEPYYDPMMMRDMDRPIGKMYYSGGGNSNSSGNSSGGNNGGSTSYYGGDNGYDVSVKGNNARGGGTRGYSEREYSFPEMRDQREGRSPMSRKMYMESKEMNKDKLTSLQGLEKYMKELSEDMVEMIEGASQEERQLLQKKLNMLAQKITSD